MKIRVYIILICTIILATISCRNSEGKYMQIAYKNIGKWESVNDSLSVELKPSQFESYKRLLERTQELYVMTVSQWLQSEKEMK